MRIRVTQRDIDEGVQSNCFHCPVARAVKRVFRATEVWVREIIIVTKAGAQRAYVTPTAAVDFIERFDSAMLGCESPKPFSFTLDERVRATLGGNPASQVPRQLPKSSEGGAYGRRRPIIRKLFVSR